MRIVIVIMTGVLICAVTISFSQAQGRIDLVADPGGVSCNILDTAPGLVRVHMLVTQRLGVTAVQFAAPKPACWVGATWLLDEIAFGVPIGDSQNNLPYGLAIGFGACLDSPIYLGAIVYLTQGQALPCCYYPVVKTEDTYPEIPTPVMVTCDFEIDGIAGGHAIVNAQPGCSCDEPVPVEQTTWGAMKALYE